MVNMVRTIRLPVSEQDYHEWNELKAKLKANGWKDFAKKAKYILNKEVKKNEQ